MKYCKRMLGLLIGLSVSIYCTGQANSFADTASLYFEEIKEAAAVNKGLWGIDINGPLLLVDPQTRQLYASHPDSIGMLERNGTIYTGILPKQVNISNTALKWNGTSWAMVMLPLPLNYNARINLLAHELFHRSQKVIGFFAANPDNNHLDKKEGRIYLRLELEALKMAVVAKSALVRQSHLKAALAFRKYRYLLYAGADSTENLLELNEGICEYTGMMMSGRNTEQQKRSFINRINEFLKNKSYVRSFAYETIPVYGWLLQQTDSYWNQRINNTTRLPDFFAEAFSVHFNTNHEKMVKSIGKKYRATSITAAETEREKKSNAIIAQYKLIFLESSHVEIPLEKMNMSFDYLSIIPLEDKGTVYPTIRITDNWGILDVHNGALISADWRQVNVTYPLQTEGNKISGEGWTLELKNGYVLEKDTNSINYRVKKL